MITHPPMKATLRPTTKAVWSVAFLLREDCFAIVEFGLN